MPTVKLYKNGLTMGIPPSKNNHVRAKRGDVQGWSKSATRNNKNFLYSIDTNLLNGVGYAFTLTLRNCPATSDEWRELRNRFLRSISENPKLKFIRLHWVTEWQRRGVPHLHGIVFYDDNPDDKWAVVERMSWISKVWVNLTKFKYESSSYSQYITPITSVTGWFKYLSKHAVRGIEHYQRSNLNIPTGWVKTGRVWGYKGQWDVSQPVKVDLSKQGYYRFRRIVRAWRKSDARSEKVLAVRKARIVSARSMLSCSDRVLSEVRGVSEWIPEDIASNILWHLVYMGYEVTEREISP